MRPLKFILIFLIVSLQAVGQTNIQVIIKNKGQNKIDRVEFSDLSQHKVFKLPYSDTLNFLFNKNNIDCYNIFFFEGKNKFTQQIWLDTGNIKIFAHIDSSKFIIDTVLNSPIFYNYLNIVRNYITLYKKKDTSALYNYLLDTYLKNIENPFSLLVGGWYIDLNQNSKINLMKLKILSDRQGEKYKGFSLYSSGKERLDKILTKTKLDLDSFSFINKENKEIKISLKGADYYVLDLWFLACPPCVRDHKDINTNLAKLEQRKIQLISISIDNNIEKWREYLISNKYNWQNYLQAGVSTLMEYLSISTFPTYLILDNAGNIICTYNTFSDVLKKFDIYE